MSMTLQRAQQLIAEAIEKAKKDYKRPICVAVCDAQGFPVAFARMDGSPIRSIDISRRKAFTAVRMGVSTAAFFARLQKDNLEAHYFGDELVPLPGGNVIKDGESVIGGIGISGLAATEDQEIANAVTAAG